jgi:RNA-binding protein
MQLSEGDKKTLRGLGHALHPLVSVGAQGLRPSVIAALEEALRDHELVKIKVAAAGREARDALVDELATATGAALVQRIGHTALLFRRNPERPRIQLSGR